MLALLAVLLLAGPADDFRRSGDAAAVREDWLAARAAYRRAIALGDREAETSLATVQAQCSKNAKRMLAEAKAYLAAENVPEARKSLATALRYADESLPEHEDALKLWQLVRGIEDGSVEDASISTPPATEAEVHRDTALAAMRKQDWLTAREEWRAAIEADSRHDAWGEQLALVTTECAKAARRSLAEAKAYLAADNFVEAHRAAQEAMRFSEDGDRAHDEAQAMLMRVDELTASEWEDGEPVDVHTSTPELTTDARARLSRGDLIGARRVLRAAIVADPSTALVTELEQVEARCDAAARRYLSEARVYLGAGNERDAVDSLRRVTQYADVPTSRVNVEARELLTKLGYTRGQEH